MHLAAELFEQVLQQDPTNGTAAVNLKMARAAAAATKPPVEYAREHLARVRRELREGRFALAERHLSPVGERTLDAEAFTLRSEARLALGKGKQALSDAGRALSLDPSARRPLLLMAEAHRRLGQRAKARYYYRLFLTRATTERERKDARRKLLELGDDAAD
jgi:tetratricopeptide (TPR) repeat protein